MWVGPFILCSFKAIGVYIYLKQYVYTCIHVYISVHTYIYICMYFLSEMLSTARPIQGLVWSLT